MHIRMAIALALILPMGVSSFVNAQAYPTKPLRIIVPFAAGGTTDILARLIGGRLSEKWGQQVVADNRPGAGGTIATTLAANATPDGYTLFLGSMGTHSMNVSIYSKLPFDPVKDFSPISLVANSSNLLAVHPSVPVSNLKELIKLAKSHPGKLNYSTSGSGSFNHMSAVLFQLMADINMTHIPYKGGSQALLAVVSGEANVIFQTVAPAIPLVKSNKIKALVVCAASRHPLLPDLPTASESGLPGFEISSWYGILAPATPQKKIVEKLHDAIAGIVKSPEGQKNLISL